MKESSSELDFYVGRHSDKPTADSPEAQDYPGISEAGVETATAKAGELKTYIDSLPQNAVILVAGATDLVRTKSTLRAYGNGLRSLYEEDPNTEYVDAAAFINYETGSMTRGINLMAERINHNTNKRFIITAPLTLEEFSTAKHWSYPEGAPYEAYLSETTDAAAGFTRQWVKESGIPAVANVKKWQAGKENPPGLKDLIGPNPKVVADEYLAGLRRLQEFAYHYAPDRPIAIVALSHHGDLDAVITRLAKGKVSEDALHEVFGDTIPQTNEGAYVHITDGETTVDFRGNQYTVTK